MELDVPFSIENFNKQSTTVATDMMRPWSVHQKDQCN